MKKNILYVSIQSKLLHIKSAKINKLIELTNNYINEKEASTLIIYFTKNNKLTIDISQCEKFKHYDELNDSTFIKNKYLFDESETNNVIAFKVLHKYSIDHNMTDIRDTIRIFNDYIKSII